MSELKMVSSVKVVGSGRAIEVELRMGVWPDREPTKEEERAAGHLLDEFIKKSDELQMNAKLADPTSAESKGKAAWLTAAKAEFKRAGLDPIYIMEIPNQYCPGSCCYPYPWLNVTTSIGPFIVGWRKRVIHLEWPSTLNPKTSDDLFPKEDVTKDRYMIHCWSYEKLGDYLKKILEIR
jgi:hypothetical protein